MTQFDEKKTRQNLSGAVSAFVSNSKLLLFKNASKLSQLSTNVKKDNKATVPHHRSPVVEREWKKNH